MTVAIIDDEPKARAILRVLIQQYCPDFHIVGEASDVASGLELIRKEQPDVVLLDIRMPDGTGLDLVEKLGSEAPYVIFVTAYDQYALQAFRLSAVDYILKPVIPSDLVKALNKAGEVRDEGSLDLRLKAALENFKGKNSPGKLVLKTTEAVIVVRIDEIVRCQSDANYTTFFLENGRSLVVSRTLKEYEQLLSPAGFLRIHQSHLVNLQFLREFRKREDQILLTDGSKAPVASRKREVLMRAIEAMEYIP